MAAMHASQVMKCRPSASQSIEYLQLLTAWRKRPLAVTATAWRKRASTTVQTTSQRHDNSLGWNISSSIKDRVKSTQTPSSKSGKPGVQPKAKMPLRKDQPKRNANVKGSNSGRVTKVSRPSKQGQSSMPSSKAKPRSKGIAHVSSKSNKNVNGSKPRPQVMNSDHMLRTLTFPTIKDYPYAPSTLVSNRFAFVKDLILQGFVDVQKTMSDTGPHHSKRFKCDLTCRVGDHEAFWCHGEGEKALLAFRAAQLNLLASLHSKGILQEYWWPSFENEDDAISQLGAAAQPFQVMPPTEASEKQLQKDIQAETGAKADVFDYVAKFGSIPTIAIVVQRARSQHKLVRYYVASVSFPDQDIAANVASRSSQTAESGACILFKRLAEKYQSEMSSEPIIVKDSESINSSNAKDFLEFYRSTVDKEKIRIEIQPASGSMWSGQAFINDVPLTEPATMPSKKKTEALTALISANMLKNRKPDLFEDFLNRLREGNGQFRLPIPPQTMNIDSDCLLVMRRAIVDARRAGLSDIREDLPPEEDLESYGIFRGRHSLSQAELKQRNKDLLEAQKNYGKDPKSAELKQHRDRLPIVKYTAQLEEMISRNIFSIVIGSTGSGKTTQVPQILLESAIAKNEGATCNIICTQPRRIAAVSVAQRVAVERNEQFQDTVGHHVRFDSKPPRRGGSITYCTTGVLLKQLQHHADQVLDGVSHLVIDEVHERSIISDFLLIMLKNLVVSRLESGKRMPKIILMSATMDMEKFSNYFGRIVVDGKPIRCPSTVVPGRTFPVQEKYYEDILKELKHNDQDVSTQLRMDQQTSDYMDAENTFISETTGIDMNSERQIGPIDWKAVKPASSKDEGVSPSSRMDGIVPINLVAATITHIAKTTSEGAILVFLPGIQEIRKVSEKLSEKRYLGISTADVSQYQVFMLHSSLPDGQVEVFKQSAPGCRKIILATNIAETSLTIPDAQYVVDTGKVREKQYDQLRQITSLPCTWISKSSSRQRSGRAGRVQNGHYYALFSKARFDSFRPVGSPEMLRSDLQEVCLSTKLQAPNILIKDFLSKAMDPPSPVAIDASIRGLQSLEALTVDEALTPLGRLLEALPVHPSLGKMIVLGIIFRCLDPMLILAAMAGEREMFISPLGQKKVGYRSRLYFGEGSGSDHIAAINAFRTGRQILAKDGWRAVKDWAFDHNIHFATFKSIDSTISQIANILFDAGLVPKSVLQRSVYEDLGGRLVNENADNISLIKALSLAGMQPNLAVSMGGTSFRTPSENHARVPQNSITVSQLPTEKYPFGTLLIYHSLIKSPNDGRVTLRECAKVTPLLATLFGGSLKANKTELIVDNWLKFTLRSDPYEHLTQPVREMYWREGEAIKTVVEFRKSLDRLLTSAFRDLNANRGSQRSGNYLAEDRTRQAFSHGLVAVLDRDIGVRARR